MKDWDGWREIAYSREEPADGTDVSNEDHIDELARAFGVTREEAIRARAERRYGPPEAPETDPESPSARQEIENLNRLLDNAIDADLDAINAASRYQHSRRLRDRLAAWAVRKFAERDLARRTDDRKRLRG